MLAVEQRTRGFYAVWADAFQSAGTRTYTAAQSKRQIMSEVPLVTPSSGAAQAAQHNVISWLDKSLHTHRDIIEGLSAAGATLRNHDSDYLHHWEF